MNYLSNLVDYIYSFFYEDDTILLCETYKSIPKPFFQYQFLDDIDFDNTPTSDIVIRLNNMKQQFFFESHYNKIYDSIYNKNNITRLNKLKFVLLSCLESKNDTTDIMIKHVKKYKGEKIILDIIEEDNEYKELEKRYNKLLKDIEEDNNEDNNENHDNNTDGMDGVKVSNKKRIALLN
jgi:hypothetical protein